MIFSLVEAIKIVFKRDCLVYHKNIQKLLSFHHEVKRNLHKHTLLRPRIFGKNLKFTG